MKKTIHENLVKNYVIFSSSLDQPYIPCFTTARLSLDDYYWYRNFLNHTKLTQKISNNIFGLFRRTYFPVDV